MIFIHILNTYVYFTIKKDIRQIYTTILSKINILTIIVQTGQVKSLKSGYVRYG